MKMLDKFLAEEIAVLRKCGIIKNQLHWKIFLQALAILHFLLAFMIVVLLSVIPEEIRFSLLLTALALGAIGFVWHRASKKLLE